MRKILNIASVTFKEMIRQPIFSIMLILSGLTIYISPWFSMFTLLNSDKLVRDMGLATILLASILVAAFSSSGLVYREIENRIALTILSKPIHRLEFLLGKYFGLLGGIFVIVAQLTIILVLTMRMGVPETASMVLDKLVIYTVNSIFLISLIWAAAMNYFFEKSFTSSFVKTIFVLLIISFVAISFINSDFNFQPFGTDMELGLIKAGILIFLGMSILTSIALLGSIRFNMLANLIFCMSIFFVTMTSDYFFGRFADENIFCKIIYWICPNLQFFWVADAFLRNQSIPAQYLGITFVYSLGCVIFMVILSWVSFSNREIA